MANEKTEEKTPVIITVKSNLPAGEDGSSPVALWEKNPAHPDQDNGAKGEIFVTGDKTFQVAETPEVLGALRDERIVKVDAPKKKDEAKP